MHDILLETGLWGKLFLNGVGNPRVHPIPSKCLAMWIASICAVCVFVQSSMFKVPLKCVGVRWGYDT